MLTIDSGMVPGSKLPSKGRIPLTNSLAFISHDYFELPLLFKNPNPTSTAWSFASNDVLRESFTTLIRDHYAPLSGWIEIEGAEVYLTWDNYKDGIYSPKNPPQFKADTIDTDYDTFCAMAEARDPRISHSKTPACHTTNMNIAPLITVKITRFGPNDQAVIVNVAVSHMAMDMCSYSQFFLNWAALCRQMFKPPGLRVSTECEGYEIPHAPLFGVIDFGKFRDLENKNYQNQAEEKEKVEDISMFVQNALKSDEYKLVIPENKQKEIREAAHLSGVSFQLNLFAMIVKEEIILQVHKSPEIVDKVVNIRSVADVRPRLGIDENYCSSAILMCNTMTTVGDILEMSSVEIARKMKDSMDSEWSPEGICGAFDNYISIWKRLSLGDMRFEKFRIEYFGRNITAPGFEVNSYLYFKLGWVDFGTGGPEGIYVQKAPLSGLIYIHPLNPNTPGNDIRLSISIPKECDISTSLLSEFVVLDQEEEKGNIEKPPFLL